MEDLTLDELKRLHDKAYVAGQVTRERGSDDMVFYYVTQWDDNILQESQLAYRGEFNIIKKAGRQILSDLASNPVQVDFEPIDETRQDAAEALDGLYRADDNKNMSQEAMTNSAMESVVCGMGAWELYTDYVTSRGGVETQIIKRRPVFEANNSAFCDPNAKLLDKADAEYWSVLAAYSEGGYKKLVMDLTGEDVGDNYGDSFKFPEHSYTFPWIGGESKKIYITSFYHRTKIKENIYTLEDPFGQVKILREADVKEKMDDLLDAGFEIVSEKKVERYEIKKYIASGANILSVDVIAGQHIPIVPQYGEHSYVEGEEHYEGVTRLAKDPQRLRNFQLSYLADIVSRSPRTKPIFLQEQVASFENMYSESGAENNFPYLLQNRVSGDGTELPIGPIAVMPEQSVPVALVQSIALSREAVEDVANPGIPQDIADPDLSGKAVLAIQNRMDMQSMIYQEHGKHSKRRDAEIYASMASEVYDVARTVNTVQPDGTRSTVNIMEQVMDEKTGDIVTLNDLSNAEFEIYSTIGPSYSSQKEQTIDRIETMRQGLPPGDPMGRILMLKQIRLMDGIDFDDVREYANKELIIMGIKEPSTPEEEEMLAQSKQKGQQPNAEMMLALAEMEKGKAQQKKAEIEGFKAQNVAANNQGQLQVDTFEAQTDRMNTQVAAQKAGAEIDDKKIESFGKKLDNTAKMIELQSPEKMSTDQLYEQIMTG